jgi:hypothetical protein
MQLDDKIAAFFARVTERMHAGQRQYGDRSWSRSPDALLDEIQQELEDVAGWSIVLWSRLQSARLALLQQQSVGGDDDVD